MLSSRRHSLRFVIRALVAVWATATVAAGVTYFIVSEADEGHYHGIDYNSVGRCRDLRAGSSLLEIHGFVPISAGESALVTRAEGRRAPHVIYVWKGGRCVNEWSLDDDLDDDL